VEHRLRNYVGPFDALYHGNRTFKQVNVRMPHFFCPICVCTIVAAKVILVVYRYIVTG